MAAPVTDATGTNSTKISGSTSPLTLTKPSGVVDGDLIIIVAHSDESLAGTADFTVSTFNDVFASVKGGVTAGASIKALYKVASSEGANWSVARTGGSGNWGAIAIRVSHGSGTPAIDTSATATSILDEGNTPDLTTSVNDCLVIRGSSWNESKTLTAVPSGTTQIQWNDLSSNDGNTVQETKATAGSVGAKSYDLSSATQTANFTISIKPPAGSSPQTINATALASTAALGSPILQPGSVTISPAALASTSALGTASMVFSINPTSIGTTLTLGTPVLTPGNVDISPTGKASTLVFGTPTITGLYTISPTGISLTSTLGTVALTSVYIISPTGKASTAALGSPTLSPGEVIISPASLPSVLALGTVTLSSTVTMSPSSIASTLQMGSSRAFASPVFTPLGVVIGTFDTDATVNDDTAEGVLNSPDNEDTITTVSNEADLEGADDDATLNTPTTNIEL